MSNEHEQVRGYCQALIDKGMTLDELEKRGMTIAEGKERARMLQMMVDVTHTIDNLRDHLNTEIQCVEELEKELEAKEGEIEEAYLKVEEMQDRVNTLVDMLGTERGTEWQ